MKGSHFLVLFGIGLRGNLEGALKRECVTEVQNRGMEGVSDVRIKQNLGVVLTLAYSTRLGQVLGVPPDTKTVKDTPRIGAYAEFLVTSVGLPYTIQGKIT